ncbi:MAG: type IV pilus assembly protein PilM [bacterium]
MLANLFSAKKAIAIDIGTGTVKAIEVHRTRSGVEISRIYIKEIPFVETDTPEARTAAVIETVTTLIKESRFSAKKAVFGLAGHQVFVRKLRLPQASEDRLAKIITYEARQQIPFPLDKIQLDYQVSPIPDSTEVEVLLVGSKKDSIIDYTGFLSKTGIKPLYLDVTPVALFNFQQLVDSTPTEEAVALINIGASSTDISIVRNGKLSFTRTAPLGGIELTRGIATSLNVSLPEAEKIKIAEGKAEVEFDLFEESGEQDAAQQREKTITTAIAAGLEKLVGEIRRTFDYYISQPDGIGISQIIISGGTSKLPEIDRFLEMKIGTPVTLIQNYPTWQMFNELKDNFAEQLPFVTTGVGLALRGLPTITNTIKVDFLPAEMKSVREFSAKRIEFGIATTLLAAIIFIGSRFGGTEIELKRQAIDLLNKNSNTSKVGYERYQKVNTKNQKLSKQYEELMIVIGSRTFWLDMIAKLNSMTPVDVWFTKITGNVDYTLVIEGKALTSNSVVELGKKFGNPNNSPRWFKSAKLDMMRDAVPDDRLGKPVAIFRFVIQCTPPKLTS